MKAYISMVVALLVLAGCGTEISYYKRGVYYENKGDYGKAIREYRASIKHDSTYALSYMGIGSVMMKNKQWEPALENLLLANTLGINNQDFFMMLGQVYEELGRMDLAAEVYGRAIKDRPDDVLLHLTLGASLEKNRDFEGALAEYNSAIALAIDFPEAYYHSARMLTTLNKVHEAEENYLQALKLKNNYVQAQNNLTVLYLDSDRIRKARESAEKTLKIDAGYVPGVVNMGIVHELLGERKKAEGFYRKAIEIDASSYIAHFRLAMLLIGDQRDSDALEEFNKTLEFRPDFSPAYNEMGLMALDNGNFSKALECLSRAVAIDSTFAIAYFNLGGIYSNMGEFRKAADAYTRYLQYARAPSDSTEIQSRIGILLSAGK